MRGATLEEAESISGLFLGLLPRGPKGEISFEIITPKASCGGQFLPEGVYINPDAINDPESPMSALVVENAIDGNSQTIHVLAKSMEGAQKLVELFHEGKIQPQVALEEAPAAIRKLLSQKRQRLIIANRRK